MTAEGIEEEAEIEVNATRNGQDGENDNQMGKLLEPEGDLKKERVMLLRILNFQRSKLASFFIGFKSTNLLAFKGNSPAKQHPWLFTMQTSGLLENDAQRVMLFASTLQGLVFDLFERLLEESIQTFHDLKPTFKKKFQEETQSNWKTLLETCQKEGEFAKDY